MTVRELPQSLRPMALMLIMTVYNDLDTVEKKLEKALAKKSRSV